MTEDVPAEETPEIEAPGVTLTTERERQGLTVPQLARDLHLEPRLIERIESGEFSEIGAPVFVKGHLRSYARRLGLDADEILEAYKHHEPDSDELTATARATLAPVRDRGPVLVLVALVVLAAIAAGAAWLWLNRDSGEPVVTSPASGSATNSAPAGIASPARTIAAAPPVGSESNLSSTTSGETLAERVPDSIAAPASVARDIDLPATAAARDPETTVGNADVASIATADAAESAKRRLDDAGPDDAGFDEDGVPSVGMAAAGVGDLTNSIAAARLAVDLAFTDDCWVEISDANGRLKFDLQRAGTRLALNGVPPVRMLLGNASAVRLAVAGEQREIPGRRISNNVARLVLPRDLDDSPERDL